MSDSREPSRPIELLVVDDSASDARLTKEALTEARVESNVRIASDGVEALELLRSDVRRPDIILLDLDMPRMDGRQTLAELKADPALRAIPVVVLSGSEDVRDVKKTYSLQANCYVSKPVDLDDYTEVVKAIASFWLNVAQLPAA